VRNVRVDLQLTAVLLLHSFSLFCVCAVTNCPRVLTRSQVKRAFGLDLAEDDDDDDDSVSLSHWMSTNPTATATTSITDDWQRQVRAELSKPSALLPSAWLLQYALLQVVVVRLSVIV